MLDTPVVTRMASFDPTERHDLCCFGITLRKSRAFYLNLFAQDLYSRLSAIEFFFFSSLSKYPLSQSSVAFPCFLNDQNLNREIHRDHRGRKRMPKHGRHTRIVPEPMANAGNIQV